MANEVRLIVGAATDVGKVRDVNEDSLGFLYTAAGQLLVVCDGMGGHAAGDLASRTARDAILGHVLASPNGDPRDILVQAALRAHEAVRGVAGQSAERAGMGTTCVMALIRGDQAVVANVGDSRCYLVRNGKLRQVSKDHTKAQQLLEAGVITADQMAKHPDKGVLSQALGQRAQPTPFVTEPFTLMQEDYLILCSDGVYESMQVDMPQVSEGRNPNYAADALVRQAVARDGKDNATVVIGRFVDLEANAAPVVVGPLAGKSGRRVPAWAVPAVVAFVIGAGCVGLGAHFIGCGRRGEKVEGEAAVPVVLPEAKAEQKQEAVDAGENEDRADAHDPGKRDIGQGKGDSTHSVGAKDDDEPAKLHEMKVRAVGPRDEKRGDGVARFGSERPREKTSETKDVSPSGR